jgi:hypothetical protein
MEQADLDGILYPAGYRDHREHCLVYCSSGGLLGMASREVGHVHGEVGLSDVGTSSRIDDGLAGEFSKPLRYYVS